MTKQQETNLAFDFLAHQIEGTGSLESSSAVKALSVRFNLPEYAGIQALSEMAGNASKNLMVNQLVSAAIDEVVSRLSDAKRSEFRNLQSQALTKLIEEGGLESMTERMGAAK